MMENKHGIQSLARDMTLNEEKKDKLMHENKFNYDK